MDRRLLLVPIILFAFSISIFSAHGATANTTHTGKATLYIFGIDSQTGVGVPALLTLTVTNGSGQVFLGSTPLSDQQTQAQATVSVDVACQLVNINCNKYNFYYYITSSSSQVGGPSAGAAFTVAAMAILTGKSLNSQVAMTGTANPDGSMGIVGDVAAKSQAAADQGIKIFLYPANEPSADNMTQAALAYDENLGEVAIPVSSIYEAYQYFTGYNITPILNYSIVTPLYNSVMKVTYSEFSAYQQSLYNQVIAQNSTNTTVQNLLSYAQSAMSYQNTLATEGNYYVAASNIVNSSAALMYAYTLEKLGASQNPMQTLSTMISAENVSIQNTYNNISGNYLTNTSTLELKLIAIDRLTGYQQATYLLNQAESSLNPDITTSAYLYSLAEIKRVSAIFWVAILPPGNSNFSESSYSNLSNYYLYKASSFTDYATLLGLSGSAETTVMQDYFDSAQSYQSQGHYVASIFSSLECIADAELIIEENSIATNNSLSQVPAQISASALRSINTAEDVGVTPFLGISYYQFGNNFANDSLANYLQYSALSRTYTGFESALANASALPFLPILQVITPPSVLSYQDIAYLLLGFAVGVVISGFIYEYKLYKITKKNRRSGKNKTRRLQK